MQHLIDYETKGQRILYKIFSTLLYIIFPPCWLLAFFGSSIYGKIFKNKITSVFNRYILPPAAVVGLFFYVFSLNEIYPFGNKTIAWCDLTQQGVPYWMNFKSVLEGEENLFLNMGNAAGLNGWSLLRGYFLYPLNYLALFFERGEMMETVTLLSVLKLSLCSVTAMIFFKIAFKKLHPSLAVGLSMMYSFCAFGLMYYQIINWPDMMYILPLYFAGVYRLINKGKIAMYSITLACVLNNFSFGFMTVMATILFFGYYAVCSKNKDVSAKKVFLHFAIGSAFAALLCAHSWLPFFSSYGASARGEELSETLAERFLTKRYTIFPVLMSTSFIFIAVVAFKRYAKNQIEKASMFLFGMMMVAFVLEPINAMWHGGSYMSFPGRYLFITTFLGLTIAAALLSRKQTADQELCVPTLRDENKNTLLFFSIFAGVMLLMIFNEMAGGASSRDVFANFSAGILLNIIALSVAVIGIALITTDTHKSAFTVKVCKNLCSLYILYVICSYIIKAILAFIGEESNKKDISKYATSLWGNETSFDHVIVVFLLLLIVYYLCYSFYRWKLISKHTLALALVIVMGVEAFCALNIYMVPPINKVGTDNFEAYADLGYKVDDEGFYRVKNERFLKAAYVASSSSEANFPGAIGYDSMGHYSSLASETYLYFAKALGYSSMWMKIESFGGTKFSDALMCVRYGIDKVNANTDSVYENELFELNQKDYFLPLGAFTPDDDLYVDLERIERIKLQEDIFDSLTGNQYDLFAEYQPKAENCTFKINDDKGERRFYIQPKNGSNATLTYKIKIEGTKTLYFDCFDEYSNDLSEKIYKSFSVKVNGTTLKSSYPVDTSNGILDLGTFTDETVTVTLSVLKSIQCRSFGVYAMDDELLNKTLPNISTAGLEVKGNEIVGSYKAAEQGNLIVSISDIGGYKCTVNGKNVKVSQAYGGLISIPVNKGDNSIVISYVPPLVYPSIALVIVGIIIGIAALVVMKKLKRETVYDTFERLFGGKATDIVALIAKIGTIVALVAVVIALYVYPMVIKLNTFIALAK